MADNILTKDRADVDLDIAAKDIAGVQYPRNILVAPDGTDLTPLTDAQLRAAAVPVSAAALPLPTGAATEATLSGISGKLPALDSGRIPVSLPPGGGGLTDTELRATPIDVHDHEAALMFLRFFNLFSAPPGYDPTLQRARGTVLVESGTVTTVSTVTAVTTVATVTNQAQIDGVQGRLAAYGADLSAWSDSVRARIT